MARGGDVFVAAVTWYRRAPSAAHRPASAARFRFRSRRRDVVLYLRGRVGGTGREGAGPARAMHAMQVYVAGRLRAFGSGWLQAAPFRFRRYTHVGFRFFCRRARLPILLSAGTLSACSESASPRTRSRVCRSRRIFASRRLQRQLALLLGPGSRPLLRMPPPPASARLSSPSCSSRPRSSPRGSCFRQVVVLVDGGVQLPLDAGALLLVRLDEVVDQRLLWPARPRGLAAYTLGHRRDRR